MKRTAEPAAPSLLTIPDVAARLRCSRPHVYRLINAGALRTTNIAEPGSTRSKTRVTEEALQAYLDARV